MPFLKAIHKGDKVPHALAAFNTGTARPLVEFHEALLRGDSPLEIGERELIAAFVSATNACAYCEGAHAAAAANFGVAPDLVEHLLRDLYNAPISDAMKPVLQFARKLTLTPSHIMQADVDTLIHTGWTERAVYDVIQIVALYNFMNRFVDGLGLSVIPEDFEKEGAMLAHGYKPIIDAFGLR